MPVTRADVVAEARRWIGCRYRHQGRVKAGVDCVGLLIGVMRALGAVPPDDDITGYAREPDGVSFQRHCAAHLLPIDAADARPGDVVSIAFRQHPMHLAILGDYAHGGLSMIHALAMARRVVEHRLDDVWRSRVVGWHRLREVEA